MPGAHKQAHVSKVGAAVVLITTTTNVRGGGRWDFGISELGVVYLGGTLVGACVGRTNIDSF